MQWKFHHPKMTAEHLGLIPAFLSEDDPRPAAQQIHANYKFGGGWLPMRGWTMAPNGSVQYGSADEPDADPPLKPLAETRLREEVIRFYESAWLSIQQPDGSFEISRVD